MNKPEPVVRKRAIIYCRVSTDKQEQDGESLEYQEEKCHGYAALHDMDVLLVLKEAKSGFIHYSLCEKLTLARQFIREKMADVIIVWDLRRFSRNFVHSAMIFEEIESAGGEIVSVSENIDNSLTGKLIRSILAWSAESEREKILEYANRHWQTRLEQNLPVGTGRAPYGWCWKDKDKTQYDINEEDAKVRLSIFTMFVEYDMSVRAIAHKLTEDGILPPAKSRGTRAKSEAWRPSTVHGMLTDVANIGILKILKTTQVMMDDGYKAPRPNEKMKIIPNGLPKIIPHDLYELAQMKLKTNYKDKSHMHKKPEDFPLKGHIFCKTCGYRMVGRYRTSREVHTYSYYTCNKYQNKYDACPDQIVIRTNRVNQIIWEDCCRVFERLDLIHDTIEFNIKQSLQMMLEDTYGAALITELEELISYDRQERNKHAEGSYYYMLISREIREKEEKLRRYEEEYKASIDVVKLSNVYQKSILGFLDFLSVMKGKYHEATFKDMRNALYVLGVKVYIHPLEQASVREEIVTEQEWFTVREASALTGIAQSTLRNNIHIGNLKEHRRGVPTRVIGRDDLAHFLKVRRPDMSLDSYQDAWFSANKISQFMGRQ